MATPAIHEFVVLKFKDGFDLDAQVETMRELDPILAALDGFVSREYFFSDADQRWVDHVVWASLEAATASEEVLDDPAASRLFARFDPASIVFGRYGKVEPA
jgi:hypothetical protein